MERTSAVIFQEAVRVLPAELRQRALALREEEQGRVEELRLRTGFPMTAVLAGREKELGGPAVNSGHLERLLEYGGSASFHTVLPQLRRGYLTLEGGHRLGFCGRAVLRDGELVNIRPLSSAGLRIARELPGTAEPILPAVCAEGRLVSTLILAPPGLGKTTLLRDLIRLVSEGEGCVPLRVALADERGEVAAMYGGRPQLQIGRRTDVLEGCPKGEALMLLLRAMNPQVLAVDEITAGADVEALTAAVGCGVTLLATAHGESREDLKRRSLYRRLLEEHLFERLVQIRRTETGRDYQAEVLD